MLPCIAAVAIATFIGTKALKSNANESNSILMENVEALSAGTEGLVTHIKCKGTKETCWVIDIFTVIDGKPSK